MCPLFEGSTVFSYLVSQYVRESAFSDVVLHFQKLNFALSQFITGSLIQLHGSK